VRVRDARLLKDSFDDNLKVYEPAEIWLADLAIDVIAMLGALPGLPGQTRALAVEDLRCLDRSVQATCGRRGLKQAGEGQEAFRRLGGGIPRHVLDAAR
jgi:hypothetical protein